MVPRRIIRPSFEQLEVRWAKDIAKDIAPDVHPRIDHIRLGTTYSPSRCDGALSTYPIRKLCDLLHSFVCAYVCTITDNVCRQISANFLGKNEEGLTKFREWSGSYSGMILISGSTCCGLLCRWPKNALYRVPLTYLTFGADILGCLVSDGVIEKVIVIN